MPTNIIGSATIRIIPDSSAFTGILQKQLQGVNTAINRSMGGPNGAFGIVNKHVMGLSDNLGRMANRASAVGIGLTYGLTRPLVGLGKAAVATAAEFDEALRTVAAVGDLDITQTAGKFTGQLGLIQDAAREIGRTTRFSAVEAAQGFTDLARAGLKPEEQIAAIATVTRLATVENIALAEASDKLIQVYTGFGYELAKINAPAEQLLSHERNLAQVGDILAKVSAATTTDMVQLSDAFRYAGPVAGTAGVSFEEAAAALGTLAQAGFQASIGGTALRGIITRLAVPTQVNKDLFENLKLSVEGALGAMDATEAEQFSNQLRKMGVSGADINNAIGVKAVDSLEEFRAELARTGIKQEEIFGPDGQMRSLNETVAIFADRYNKGIFKVGDAMKLFGQRAGPGFLALIHNAALLQSVTEGAEGASGALKNMSDKIGTSATIKFQMMKNAFVDLDIAIGQSGMLDFFVEMSQRLSGLALGLADANPEMFKFVAIAGALVAAIGPLGILTSLWFRGLNNVVKALTLITSGPIGALVGIFAALGTLLVLAVSRSDSLRKSLETLGGSILPILEQFKLFAELVGGAIVNGAKALADSFGEFLIPRIDELSKSISNWIAGGGMQIVIDWLFIMIDRTRRAGEAFIEFAKNGLGLAIMGFNNIKDSLVILWPIVTGTLDAFGKFAPLFGKVVVEAVYAFLFVWEKLNTVLGPALQFIGDNADAIILALAHLFVLARIHSFAFRDLLRIVFTQDVPRILANVPSAFLFAAQGIGIALQGIGVMIRTFGAVLQATLRPIFNALGDAFLNLGRFIDAPFATMRATLARMVIAVAIGFSRMVDAVKSFLAPFGAAIDRFTDFLNRLIDRFGQAPSLFSRIVAGIGAALSGLGAIVQRAGTALVDLFGKFIQASMSFNPAAMFASVGAFFRSIPALVGNALTTAGQFFVNFGTNVRAGFAAASSAAQVSFRTINDLLIRSKDLAKNLATVAGQALMSMFSGQMIASASDLKGMVLGLGSAITGMIVAFATGGPIMAAFVAGMIILGAVIERMSNDTKDLTNATEGYLNILNATGEAQKRYHAIQLLRQEANKLDKQNFMLLSEQLSGMKIPINDLADAFLDGGAGMEKFIKRYTDARVAIEGTGVSINEHGVAVRKNLAGEAEALGSSAHDIETVMAEIRTSVGESIEVKFLESMAKDAKLAKAEFDLLAPSMKAAKIEQEKLQKAADVSASSYEDWKKAIDGVRTSLSSLNGPANDVQNAVDGLTIAVQGAGSSFKSALKIDPANMDPAVLRSITKGTLDNLFNPLNTAGAELRNLVQGFIPDFTTATLGLASSSKTLEEFDSRFAALKGQFSDLLVQLGFNKDVADELVRKLLEFANLPDTKTLFLNTEPARKAFEEFVTKSEATKIGINLNLNPSIDAAALAKMRADAAVFGISVEEFVRLSGGSGVFVGGPMAMGGILTSPTFAMVGEDGAEVVIPLTKPGRAAQLLQDSGLYEFAVRTAMANGVAPTGIGITADSPFIGQILDPSNLPSVVGGVAAGGVSSTIGGVTGDIVAGQVDVTVVVHLLGVDEALLGLGSIQTEAASMSMAVIGYINNIIIALNAIPGTMAVVSRAIGSGFRNPIAFLGNNVWPPFARLLNAAAQAFGISAAVPSGFSVPAFHSGGLVGADGDSRSGSLTSDEMFALLLKGEGVMTREMMSSMTDDQMRAFRSGSPRWWAVGGPYETGKGYVDANPDITGSYDLAAMKAAYAAEVKTQLDAMQEQYANNIVANISTAAIDKIANGAFEWTRGANDASTERMVGQIGLPPGFDLRGVLPQGFDIPAWRSFLGANKAPGSWPLLAQYLDAAGVPYLINSTFRPGGTSYHASSRAVDFGAPNDSNWDSPGLLRINHALAPMLGVLQELIYSGPGGISDKMYDASTMAQHHNHVHAALANGGLVEGLLYGMLGEAGPEVVLPLNNPNRALDIALKSGLFGVLGSAAISRNGAQQGGQPQSGPSPLGYVSPNQPMPRQGSADGGFLGGGPGNTYNIYGIDEAQVRRTIKNHDEATLRGRK